MARSASRRWTNLRVSADGRTVRDELIHRRNPSGKKVRLPTILRTYGRPEPLREAEKRVAPEHPPDQVPEHNRVCPECGEPFAEGEKVVLLPPARGRRRWVGLHEGCS